MCERMCVQNSSTDIFHSFLFGSRVKTTRLCHANIDHFKIFKKMLLSYSRLNVSQGLNHTLCAHIIITRVNIY
ncbi:hypothetical protein PHYPO_G00124660 [Pangasianodon hypophthalmus]|uniref:Uncharacterized protein n=1 Tax=Pangasianodon hypophthalmus TaxID=310915 RepID=A0A5N5KR32_PANHP|nr:hypothetical protein PHYPO_G00124660 [Pangasianodon hypophthalmus]